MCNFSGLHPAAQVRSRWTLGWPWPHHPIDVVEMMLWKLLGHTFRQRQLPLLVFAIFTLGALSHHVKKFNCPAGGTTWRGRGNTEGGAQLSPVFSHLLPSRGQACEQRQLGPSGLPEHRVTQSMQCGAAEPSPNSKPTESWWKIMGSWGLSQVGDFRSMAVPSLTQSGSYPGSGLLGQEVIKILEVL